MILDYRKQWPTKSGFYDGTNPAEVALTFDDGPNDRHTLELVDLLAERGIHATFFMVGKYVRQRADIARTVHQAGHVIGNHSENHSRYRWPNWYSGEQLESEIEQCQEAIEDAIGITPALFRPPYGKAPDLVEAAATKSGLKLLLWSVTCFDWELTDSAAIVKQARQEIDSRRQGEIVLLHDGSGDDGIGANREATVAAVGTLIGHYTQMGRRFVSLSQFAFKKR